LESISQDTFAKGIKKATEKKQFSCFYPYGFVGSLPLCILLFNNRYKFLPTNNYDTHYLEIISIIWLLLNILIVIDPGLKEKISTLKDVATLKGLRGSN